MAEWESPDETRPRYVVDSRSGGPDHPDATARAARDVWWVDLLLTQLEAKLGLERTIRLEVLIEEVEGLANAEDIARASPRIDAIDSPYPDYADLDGYHREARRSALYGYTGKWAIHPSQVPVANTVFSPTPEEIALAERNMAAYREREAKGLGAVGVEGVLVDAAHVKMAQNTLARVTLIDGG